MQAAINAASNLLPNDLPVPPTYNKVNPADAAVLTLAITSPTMPLPQVRDLVDTRVAQKLSQIPGVGLVSVAGGQRPAVRVQVNPQALAANGMSLSDLRTAIVGANVNQPKGNLDGPLRSTTINANDQLKTPTDYNSLIIAYKNNAPLRLSDVARAVEGAEDVRQAAWAGDKPAILLNIQRQPGANVIDVVNRINALLPQLRVAARHAGRDRGVRSHPDHPRLGGRRAVRDAAGRGAGGDGDFRVPAQPHGHLDSQRGGAAVAGGHLRHHVPGRLLHQQPDADGADHRHRLRGGRRHRHDREHRPPHRGGRARCRRRSRAPRRSASR